MTDAVGEHEHESMWTDDSWRQWSDYADRVTVQVRFKTWLGADDADEFWAIESYGAAWPKDWLNRQLVELAAIDSSGGCCGSGTYALDSRESKTEWGASGGFFEAILTLAQDQLSNATWAALGALATHLTARLKKQRESEDWWAEVEWTDEQAREAALEGARQAALSAVGRFREVPLNVLTVKSVEIQDDGAMVVEVRDSTGGSLFTAQVKSQDGVVFVARVRKITEPGVQ
jgi:hypothetical protein